MNDAVKPANGLSVSVLAVFGAYTVHLVLGAEAAGVAAVQDCPEHAPGPTGGHSLFCVSLLLADGCLSPLLLKGRIKRYPILECS